MNNKTLIIIISVLVIVGGILLIGGSLGNKNKSATDKNTSTPNVSQPAAQNDPDAAKGKPIKEGTIEIINLTKDGFEPVSTTIKKNMVVIWINKSDKEAGVSSDSHAPLNLGRFPTGSS
ncbi:MAG: hypothetical protein AAB675_00185, partial [Patescibacteria group bacterium]